MWKHIFIVSLVPVFFGLYLLLQEEEMTFPLSPKINGASLVNPHSPVPDSSMATIVQTNSNWVAVIPFAFSRQNEPEVYFNHERQWWGERAEGSMALIQMAKKLGLKVMLKPHVWMRESWIGDFELDSEEKWLKWEKAYRDYILTFAKLADSLDVELLCIGTELKKTEVTRAAFWESLIVEVRAVYKGKITYAANWDHYEKVPFWDRLDYIGINAYFPLTKPGEVPDKKRIEEAWKPIRKEMRSLAISLGMQVVLTEFGYAACSQATERPWEEFDKSEPDFELQAVAYEGLFASLWQEDFVAGGFFWKWHLIRHADRWERGRFSPQGHPAAGVISKWYGATGE